MNPFIIAGRIPDQYFCDREMESKKLHTLIINQNNVALIAPRRLGKSGLIHHCFNNPEFEKNYSFVYVDILQTGSLREFVYLLGKKIYEIVVPKTQKWISTFVQTISSISGKISFDAITGLPSFNMMIGEIHHPELTLEQIFQFLEKYNKRVVVAIDEFQQIIKYAEKNVEAILRSHIQDTKNTNFIFSGSERHIMEQIFMSYSRPFYNSVSIMHLDVIPKEKYVNFSKTLFQHSGRKIQAEAIARIYDDFEGYTFYMQKILNTAYSKDIRNREMDYKALEECLKEILEENSVIYREILSNIPEKQKEVLYALAIEGKADKITSSQFIKKYNLTSASSVQSAVKQLLDKDFITRREGEYWVTDKFFSLFIQRLFK